MREFIEGGLILAGGIFGTLLFLAGGVIILSSAVMWFREGWGDRRDEDEVKAIIGLTFVSLGMLGMSVKIGMLTLGWIG